MDNRFFPIFVNPDGRKAVIFGGGKIAERRIKTLAEFDFDVTVVSSSITSAIRELVEQDKVRYIADRYEEKYLQGCYMVLACTSDRDTNREIGLAAKAENMLVSVCDSREECNFYFPAVAVNDEVTMGLVGSGKTHDVTRKAAARLREIIKGKAY